MRNRIAGRLEAIDTVNGFLFPVRVVTHGNLDTCPLTASLVTGEGGELLVYFAAEQGRTFNRFVEYATDLLADFELISGDGDGLALVVLPSPSITPEKIED